MKQKKTKQQLTRDYQYLFEMADQLLLAYFHGFNGKLSENYDEEVEDLTKCLEEISGNTFKERWQRPKSYKEMKVLEYQMQIDRSSEEIKQNGKNTN